MEVIGSWEFLNIQNLVEELQFSLVASVEWSKTYKNIILFS